MTTPLRVVDVSGTPEQMGEAYGAAATDLIQANVATYLARFSRSAGLDRQTVLTRGAAFRDTTRALAPRLARMLDATAGAAGLAPELIYAVNARSELLYGDPSCGAPGGAGAELGECTSIGVLDSRTADGHTVLAQNWDWHPDHRDGNLLLVTRDERGHVVAALTEAGMLAKAGLNGAGLGVCVNLLGCDRDGRPGGLPYHVLLRSVLEADSLSWATRNAVRAPRSASINLLIGQAHPSGGEIIDLELAPGEAGWLHPVDGLLTHANHFETPLPVYDTVKDWGGSSLFRSARARRQLAAAGDRLRPEDILGVLRDHHSYPVSLCRHVDPRDEEADRSETIWTVFLDLDARSMQLIPGPPCIGREGMRFTIQ
ncbi:acyl-CoA--6-aminopenicillanic acid acyl-transferase [Catellatospora sp. TT07R-123]|uniref:C45 family autoproteolytic acyltransferase/hydolase n=1 Tax=Catellatospora sp. TT07R-123 TaxID=2733863 RepID=UPI001B08AD34|nr:C45 family peptidase [Catellatospora sp. TT07R-123]GHJ50525.1 acyl-CoA--6-aminopenicillanic acid acyl-transferase [Catellatospora sp. TT07R-123]